jgi:hypothetical protein
MSCRSWRWAPVLSEQELGHYIDEHFTADLFRLETLSRYDVGSDGGDFARYLAGEPGPDMTRKGPWMDQIRSEVARGMHTYRVHVVTGPLSDYLRFEFEWGYTHNAAAGEHIRILDLTDPRRPPGVPDLVDEDFWLIEEAHGIRMHYDPEGRFTGAELVDEQTVARYRRARAAAWGAAVPFDEYWQAHPQYWRDRRVA